MGEMNTDITSAASEQHQARRAAAVVSSAPLGMGRVGWACRSIVTSARSFQAFAVVVSRNATHAASATDRACPHPTHQAPKSTPPAAMLPFSQRASLVKALAERTFIKRFVLTDDVASGESPSGIGGGGGAHGAPAVTLAEYGQRGVRPAVDVAHRAQPARDGVLHHFGQAARIRGHDR